MDSTVLQQTSPQLIYFVNNYRKYHFYFSALKASSATNVLYENRTMLNVDI